MGPLGLLAHGDISPGLPGGSRPTQMLGMGRTAQWEPSKSRGWLWYVSTEGNFNHGEFRWMKGMHLAGGGLTEDEDDCHCLRVFSFSMKTFCCNRSMGRCKKKKSSDAPKGKMTRLLWWKRTIEIMKLKRNKHQMLHVPCGNGIYVHSPNMWNVTCVNIGIND